VSARFLERDNCKLFFSREKHAKLTNRRSGV